MNVWMTRHYTSYRGGQPTANSKWSVQRQRRTDDQVSWVGNAAQEVGDDWQSTVTVYWLILSRTRGKTAERNIRTRGQTPTLPLYSPNNSNNNNNNNQDNVYGAVIIAEPLRQAESTYLAGYIPRWFTRPQTVTHPGTNWVWRSATTLIEANALPLSKVVVVEGCPTPCKKGGELSGWGKCPRGEMSYTPGQIRM